jgi:S1-C subfamily serine protease
MTQKTKRIINLIVIAVVVVCLATAVLCYQFIWRMPTTQEVFNKVSQSVVELKVRTGETIISYGSAVLVSKDGTFISNAHVVTYSQLVTVKTF